VKGSRAHHWLAAGPPLAILVGVPFANRVHAYVLGLPFLLFWIAACVLATSATMALISVLDRRIGHRSACPCSPEDRTSKRMPLQPVGPGRLLGGSLVAPAWPKSRSWGARS
jgi:hypothetical protein